LVSFLRLAGSLSETCKRIYDDFDLKILTVASVLCSWDGEEYGLLGSTEWVEEFLDPWLTDTAISYLNIDVGTSGPIPGIAASPELHTIATEIMKKVLFPQDQVLNQTLYEVWNATNDGEIGVLGSGSDYTAFLHRGIGSVRISY
jgi:N-acetylated-alpha-linked acidic dipeptidase